MGRVVLRRPGRGQGGCTACPNQFIEIIHGPFQPGGVDTRESREFRKAAGLENGPAVFDERRIGRDDIGFACILPDRPVKDGRRRQGIVERGDGIGNVNAALPLVGEPPSIRRNNCLLYTSDAADE